jgi:drug/metabolite transporter (DMT)-like permease
MGQNPDTKHPHKRIEWKTRLFTAVVILTNAFGNLFLARGMRRLAAPVDSAGSMIAAIFTPWVAGGVALLIVWLLSRMALLSWADLSYVLPVTSLGYVANAVLGHFFLGEHVSLERWSGTLLIVAGTMLVGRSVPQPEAAKSALAPERVDAVGAAAAHPAQAGWREEEAR